MDAETRQRRRDKMVKLVRNLKDLKNDYETTLDLMEEKQSELQRNESKVEYNVDVISNQNASLYEIVENIGQHPNIRSLNLSNLQLHDLTALKELKDMLKQLEHLDLENNETKYIPARNKGRKDRKKERDGRIRPRARRLRAKLWHRCGTAAEGGAIAAAPLASRGSWQR